MKKLITSPIKYLERKRSKKMDNSKNIITPSSPIVSASGNNENESENQRNSQQKTKNFMAPTFSTASKILNPKKKILSEWKPPNPDSISSKVSSFDSAENDLGKNSDNYNEDETFVPDSSTTPYDPVTNYLSPRPKFLRYNPNRKRRIVPLTLSPSVSSDSQSSFSAESSRKKQKCEQEIMEEDMEEEEVIEEQDWGLKWVLFKSLIVFFVLVISTMYISSMNSPSPLLDSLNGMKVESQDFGNITFGVVLLRNLDYESWVSDEFGEKVEILDKFEGGQEQNQVIPFICPPEIAKSKEENLVSWLNSEKIRVLDDVFTDPVVESVKNETAIVAATKYEGIEVKSFVFESPMVAQEEKFVDSEEKIHVLAKKEVKNVAGDSFNVSDQKNEGNHESQMDNFGPKSEYEVEEVPEPEDFGEGQLAENVKKPFYLTPTQFYLIFGLLLVFAVSCVLRYFDMTNKVLSIWISVFTRLNSGRQNDTEIEMAPLRTINESERTPPRTIPTARPMGNQVPSSSTSELHTSSSNISEERTARQEDGSQLRRSQRLQNRGFRSL
ncbi:uncharacterized protein LOC104883134 [Beta vulgaris subsp. vulgaris]|uniref:uncharacterized protein LOC104883134 n=1 Tax=Beta vulgaris subsp. vulgaris TaxID=3555 RepID=UPI0020369A23|nr:uncharacterized protein LOC104883134 [Beta vulgaris subsp. vulgaris]